MHRSLVMIGLALALAASLTWSAAADDSERTSGGVVPKDEQGRKLNLDFEDGTLGDWTAAGNAFDGQPVKGDTVRARRPNLSSKHEGEYWIGTYEVHGDRVRGTLTSAPFRVAAPYASFLVGGGRHRKSCVEILDAETDQSLFQVTGVDDEPMQAAVVDLSDQVGRQIRIRIVDDRADGWGHVNFDDFRFHAAKPELTTTAETRPLDVFKNAGLSPTEAPGAMTLPEGFTATLFAGEPDVQQPIAQAIDDRGRLWIAEAYSYPRRVPDDQARDRILIFEDTDGDGRFDSRKVFLDQLNLVSGLEVGFGGVWIGAAPELLFVPDANGDDVPDGPAQALLDGWGFQDTHETLNAFIWGPDGWLYGCHGVFTHSRVGKPGTPDNDRVPINAGIWRYHPVRHEFEVFAQGTSNPWGVDFNDRGQAVATACVIPHLFHIIHNARYHRQAGQHFNPYTYDDIKTIALHRHWIGATPHLGNAQSDEAGGGHAHAGAMIYLGGSWPEQYRDQIFMNNIHGARLNQDKLYRRGSGLEGNRAPDFLLANDSWSQFINLQYGPDGQMYVIDWYDKNQCHHHDVEGHDRSNGRIYKVSYENAQPAQVDLQKLNNAELVELQLNANDWYVRHARRILQERGGDGASRQALAEMAFRHEDETRRLRGLWALHVTGGLDDAQVAEGLANDSEFVRAWTIQLAMEDGAIGDETLAAFARLAKDDPSQAVRLYLAAEAQRLPRSKRWEILEGLVSHSEDAGDHNLPLMYWYAAEPLAEEDAGRALKLALNSRVPPLLPFMVRRIGALGTPEAIDLLAAAVDKSNDAAVQTTLLDGLIQSLAGKRQVEMPQSWPAATKHVAEHGDARSKSLAKSLSITFGDPAALEAMRKVLADQNAAREDRDDALAALVKVRDQELPRLLRGLLADDALRGAALRGLAVVEDDGTPEAILGVYESLSPAERRDALNTLAARSASARALLAAVAAQQVPTTDLSADVVRQLRNLQDSELDKLIAEHWGAARDSSEDAQKLIERYKKMLSRKPDQEPDVTLGRAMFAKTCQQCHTLFGTGAKIGPELTGSNRANLDYLLSNVLDSSALIGKDYQATLIETDDGRVLTGIVRGETPEVVTLVTANETVNVPTSDIVQRELSPKSMMPDDLWTPLSDHEVRSLVAYLASPEQTPMLATAENAASLFNGQDLTNWRGAEGLWSVENGEIAGRTDGLDHNEFLASDLLLGDFRLKVKVKLVDNRGNSGIQFRSQPLDDGEVQGYQADVGIGWWGKLYEERGRGLLWNESGEQHVKNGEWNEYEILAVGDRVQTWINGQRCVDLDDPQGAKQGVLALQLHSGGKTEVRFKDFEIELNPKLELAGTAE